VAPLARTRSVPRIEQTTPIVAIATGTVRSVVKGVIMVALVQSLLAAIGLWVAGVPAVGLWALLVLVVAVIQLPPILVLGPIAVWVFSANDSTVISVGFLIWSLIVSGSDGILKPIFLGRGVQVPMLVILIGAIGGMLGSGVLGLFIGPSVKEKKNSGPVSVPPTVFVFQRSVGQVYGDAVITNRIARRPVALVVGQCVVDAAGSIVGDA